MEPSLCNVRAKKYSVVMPGMHKLEGDWEKLRRVLEKSSNGRDWEKAFDRSLQKETARLRVLVKKGLSSGAPGGKQLAKLSPMTLAMRKASGGRLGKKPLVSRGLLRRSIINKKQGGSWYVGVDDKIRVKGGMKLSDIAAIQESGSKPIRIVVTDKMRKFFLAVHIKTRGSWRPRRGAAAKSQKKQKFLIMPLKASKSVIVVKIQARPFIGPVFRAERDRSLRNIVNDTMMQMSFPRR